MDLATLRGKYKETLDSIRALDAQGTLEPDAAKRMAELITEGQGLRTQIEQRGAIDGLSDWAKQSAGMVQLAKPGGDGVVATPQSIRDGGHDIIRRDAKRGLQLDEAYGEGLYDVRTMKIIGTEDYRKAFRDYIRTGIGGQVPAESMRTLQEGIDTSGGYLVPEDVAAKVISREPTPTRVQGRVTQLQTSRDALVIPKIVYNADDLYTTGIRVTWTGENPSSPTVHRVTDPVFGQERIAIYTAMLSIPVTNDMVEDTAFPLINFLAGKFAETIDLLKDNMILNGTGIGQPAGILVSPGAADNPKIVKSGSASAITAPGLITTAMTLPEQYDQNAAWCFNKVSTGNAIANLLDTANRPLWGMGVDDAGLQSGYLGRPLVGYPVMFSGFMPNVAANAYPAIFGDFSGYYLVNRIGFSLQVLRELYAESNQILVLGRIRFGGMVVEPWKLYAHQIHS